MTTKEVESALALSDWDQTNLAINVARRAVRAHCEVKPSGKDVEGSLQWDREMAELRAWIITINYRRIAILQKSYK